MHNRQHHNTSLRVLLTVFSLLLSTVVTVALVAIFWAAPFFSGGTSVDAVSWYIFAFVSGLMTVALPYALPLLFVVVPLAKERGPERALGMILTFSMGVVLVLSLYGAGIAFFGGGVMNVLHLKGAVVMNWMYFFAGIFAYVLALGEIGLLQMRISLYSGVAPKFIQKRKDHTKMFLLGMFLGNIGISFPYPAVPLLFINAGAGGSVLYGTLLFFVHGVGRVVPLMLLTLLAVVGINGLKSLLKQKDAIDRGSGWVLLYSSAFILTLGLFTHTWLAVGNNTQTLFGSFVGAELVGDGISTVGMSGILGQPLWWGNWFLLFLLLIPMWWHYQRERQRIGGNEVLQMNLIERQIDKLNRERRSLLVVLNFPDDAQARHGRELLRRIDVLEKERQILEVGVRHGVHKELRGDVHDESEYEKLRLRRNWYATLTLLLVVIFIATI